MFDTEEELKRNKNKNEGNKSNKDMKLKT